MLGLMPAFRAALTVPFRTLVTKSSATRPKLTAVMSQGPLMPCPAKVVTTLPALLSTRRQPALEVAGSPLVVGRLPTTTHPPFRMDSAVVRPIPPGHLPGRCAALIFAKRCTAPCGETETMVVPVPCWLALLLKLLTRMLPLTSLPWLWPTTATP